MEYEELSGYCMCHIGNAKKTSKEILKEKRQILEMTQKQVADKAGINLQQYQKFEGGERNIMTASFQLACRVIEALEMNISDFYHGKYVIGKELMSDGQQLCYKKMGRPLTDDIDTVC